ncbi:MAG: hypothetical protein KGM98_02440, partial [Bacteroidota bacterium]|nr:hypothetical protein [Bacteroidota bacterium]
MRLKRLSLILGLCLVLWSTSQAQNHGDISVKVSAHNGSYLITSASLNWKFGGNLGQEMEDLKSGQGTDELGSFQYFSFKWKKVVAYQGTIRWYRNSPIVIFTITAPNGVVGESLEPFPVFDQIPGDLYHFSYENKEFAAPEFSLTQTSTPWMLFNDKKEACVISPASDFIVSKLTGDGVKNITSGLNPEVQHLPKGFSHQTIMVLGKGIGHSWDIWGGALRAIYHRVRPSNNADLVLKYYGYWTDNGADYYYNYDTTKGYENTLLSLKKHYRQEGIPLGYMQLDSW